MTKYNVILTYKDGSSFECAKGVTLDRAKQIKAEAEHRKARNEFAFRDVKTVTITNEQGANND
ncbi:TPA: hypothetical protein PXA24_000008 [Mannheimia haemolytica]|nr:hypothetical protein [Mannheimia haemolytica]HDZ6746247.1 hypothetical protein [Mannheimia haemolytica]HDZ6813590.1 hypothetical protein [Mannheimia haemolytica]